MREIKFRAWDKVNKNMFDDVSTEEFIIWDKGKIAYVKDCDFMQYTGLKDKNGKEIYEGDIVKYVAGENYENTGEVIWVDEKNSVNLKTFPFMCGFVIHNEKENKTDKFDWDETRYMEVLGNMYENPEELTKDIK